MVFTLGKALACAIAVASGGAGGVFAPALVIGGGLGSAVSYGRLVLLFIRTNDCNSMSKFMMALASRSLHKRPPHRLHHIE